MSTALDHIIAGFPHPILEPIIGTPTYETLANMHLQLNANAASVQSNLGNGQLGLLAITVSDAVYATLSALPCVVPVNPGSTPNVPPGTNAANTAFIVRGHTAALRIFREWITTDNAIKQQIISCVEPMYLRAMRHRITGFANVTAKQMIAHLYAVYGRLNSTDIQENDSRMKQPYDPNLPIEALYDQVEDGVNLADAAEAAYTPAQIIAIAYNLIFATGIFPEACREWRRRPVADKTWTNFKIDFAIAHQDYKESQITANQAGYQSANHAAYDAMRNETALALANLATATASDRSTVASLTSTNSSLSSEVTQATVRLTAATQEINKLKLELATLRAGTNSNQDNNRPSRQYPPNDNYCWTHGFKVSSRHTSATCKGPHDGHQTGATRANTMNGSQKGKE
jgi:hypothetical protein